MAQGATVAIPQVVVHFPFLIGHRTALRGVVQVRERGVIPADLLAKLPDVSGAVFPSLDQINTAKDLIVANWDSQVGANVQAAP